ncbi:UNVERIFIED_CONTAM: hypothetical protein PYX00_011332 [Menopon gallinae]|uniref:Tetratricopeptide repeat protein n=1 Tax=Menopon gallinae TaxID=328185 RepID=A0AAW2H753_9NEOP
MDGRIAEEFPSIASARDAAAQKEYSTAVDIYTEVLEAAREKYDQKSEAMLGRKESVTFADGDEDLEIAWELLEICRLTFENTGNEPMLRRAHFLLGEILLNNNKIEEALAEYGRADNDNETLFRKALCYEFMGEYREGIALLEQIRSENEEFMDEVNMEILMMRQKEDEKAARPKNTKPVDDDEIINIDMNVKRR